MEEGLYKLLSGASAQPSGSGEVKRSPSNSNVYYAITIKKNGIKFPYTYEYEDYIRWLRLKGITLDVYYYELDSDRRLHVHGTFMAPRNIYRKRLCKHGWHTRIEEIGSEEDLYRWASYITKGYVNEYMEEQLCEINDYQISEYPFVG